MKRKTLVVVNNSNDIRLKGNSLVIKDGISAHAYGVARHLKKNYDITILSPGEKEEFFYDGIRFLNYGGYANLEFKVGSLNFALKLSDYFGNFDFIVVHTQAFVPAVSPLKGIFDTKLIGVFHSVMPEVKDFQTRFLIRLNYNMSKNMDAILVISDYLYENLIERYGYKPDKVAIVGNGVELGDFKFKDDKEEQIIFIGRFIETKNIIRLLECFKILLNKNKNLKLVLIGTGALYDEIKAYIKKSRIQKYVKILTDANEEEKIRELQKSKVYVSLSNVEGFGIPLVEGMACGAVPVVSDITAHRFVFQGRNVGFLVKNKNEMAEKVAYLLENEKERRKMAGEGRKLAEDMWSWEKVAEKYEKVLSRLKKRRLSWFDKRITAPVKLFLIKCGIITYYFLLHNGLIKFRYIDQMRKE